MTTQAIPDDLRLAAPDLAQRLGVILMGLAALIARGYLKHPTRQGLIVALWEYLKRTTVRFGRLATRLAEGRPPRPSRPGRPGSGATPLRFPREEAWILRDLRHEAALFRYQLERLLDEPAARALIETAPTAARLLRPVCHMLGLKPAILAPKPRPARLAAPKPAPEPAATQPPPEPPARPVMPEPPCPRLRHRWPWNATQSRKPA
jgi:hypothetical protein